MKSQLDVSRSWEKKSPIPFFFLSTKTCFWKTQKKALTPLFHLLKSPGLKQSDWTSGMDSVGPSLCGEVGVGWETRIDLAVRR